MKIKYNIQIHKYNTRTNIKIMKSTKYIQKHIRGYLLRDKLDRLSKYSICSICLENNNFNNCFFSPKCKHVFHKNCINKCITEYIITCPNCRADIYEMSDDDDNDYKFFYRINQFFELIHNYFIQLRGGY